MALALKGGETIKGNRLFFCGERDYREGTSISTGAWEALLYFQCWEGWGVVLGQRQHQRKIEES